MQLKKLSQLVSLGLVCFISVLWLGMKTFHAATADTLMLEHQAIPAREVVPNLPLNTLENKPLLPDWARVVDIKTINPNIVLDIRYATTNNFLKKKLYTVPKCALRKKVAEKLSAVQNELETVGLSLKVYDCYRPLSVTKQMWEVLPDENYVANPERGSRHNRGAAVDLTIVDKKTGKELEMPTEFDAFTEKAHRDNLTTTPESRANSKLLEMVMQKHGFVSLMSEWWHFDSDDWKNYVILDVPLTAIP